MTDAENRIQIIGRLNAALFAELQMLPRKIRDDVCGSIVSEANGLRLKPQPVETLARGRWTDWYCDACGKLLNEHNGKVKHEYRRREKKPDLPDANSIVVRVCDQSEAITVSGTSSQISSTS